LRIAVSGSISPALAFSRKSAADIGPWTRPPILKNQLSVSMKNRLSFSRADPSART
jgi:hypothetical protein